MRILWLNWRDVKNPASGGAEVVTHEIARRWVQQGHAVTLFTASFPGAAAEESVDGVRIVRRGRQYTVHYHAWRHYSRHLRGRIDAVIDEINTIPFFTPLYVQETRLAYFHQLAREVWLHESRFPLNVMGYWLEPIYLLAYRRTPAVVGSESTRADLRALGIAQVALVPYGVGVTPVRQVPPESAKARQPTLIYVGRLVSSKRVTDIVEAVHHLQADFPALQLWLVGDGTPDYNAKLKRLAAQYGLEDRVRFWGRVSQPEKLELMKQAHAIVMTSVREGWGLVVIEANALGTPAVVYDVHGLRDSVVDGETGLVCSANTPVALADRIRTLLSDPGCRLRLAAAALERSRRFSWDQNAADLMRVIQELDSNRSAYAP